MVHRGKFHLTCIACVYVFTYYRNWMDDHWSSLSNGRIGPLPLIVSMAAQGFSTSAYTQEDMDRITFFVESHGEELGPVSIDALNKATERVASNMQWNSERYEEVEEWLEAYNNNNNLMITRKV